MDPNSPQFKKEIEAENLTKKVVEQFPDTVRTERFKDALRRTPEPKDKDKDKE